MDEKAIIERISKNIKDFANGRANDIARGAETPRLAAALLQKYGQGLADAVTVFYDTPRVADTIFKVLDEETYKIDPQWREHNKERWEGQPADIITYPVKTIIKEKINNETYHNDEKVIFHIEFYEYRDLIEEVYNLMVHSYKGVELSTPKERAKNTLLYIINELTNE